MQGFPLGNFISFSSLVIYCSVSSRISNLITSYVCHLCSRNVRTGLPELMVNFVTSSYKPELLKPLVERITAIPEVVCMENF